MTQQDHSYSNRKYFPNTVQQNIAKPVESMLVEELAVVIVESVADRGDESEPQLYLDRFAIVHCRYISNAFAE